MPFTKPAAAAFDSGHATAASVRCFLAMTEGRGLPYDICSYSPPHRFDGYLATQTGTGPIWVPNGFKGGYSLRFGPSTPVYVYRNRGLTGANWAASAVTFFGIIRVTAPLRFWSTSPANTGDMANAAISPWGCGWSSGAGVAIAQGHGLLGTSKLVSGAVYTASGGASTGDMVLLPGVDYGLAVVVDDTNSGNRTRTYYLFNFLTDTLHQYSGQAHTGDTAITDHSTRADFMLNQFQGAYGGFDLACCGVANKAWSASDFDAWIADPFAMARGTYSGSGTHAFPYSTGTVLIPSYLTDQDNERVVIQSPRAIGASNDHVYTYQRSETMDFSGAITDLVHDGSDVVVTDTGNGLTLEDKTGTAGTRYAYRLRSVSAGAGTTVYTNQALAAKDWYAPLKLGKVGTSLTAQAAPGYEHQLLSAPGRRVTLLNRGKPSSDLSVWGPTVNNTGLAPQIRFQIVNGTPSSGGFRLQGIIGGTEANGWADGAAWGPTAEISYNATTATMATAAASAVQTAVRAVSGYGSVTVTGTVPSGAIVNLAFGNAQAFTNIEMWSDLATSTLTGGTQTSGIAKPVVACWQQIRGELPGTANNTLTMVLAQFLAAGIDTLSIELGTNDSQSGSNDPTSFITSLQAILAAAQTAIPGVRIAVQCPTPYWTSPPSTNNKAGAQWLNAAAAAIQDLADGETIFAGRDDILTRKMCHPFSLYANTPDGVHWDLQQYGYALALWCEPIQRIDGVGVTDAEEATDPPFLIRFPVFLGRRPPF